MNKAQALHNLGQSLWLDNITREMLDNGTLRRYIDEFSITGLTSNPTIFDEAIGNDERLRRGDPRQGQGRASRGEALFVELALEDLRRAADLFRPVFEATRTASTAGSRWRSRRCSPTIPPGSDRGGRAHARAQGERPNLFVKIPGTPEGVPAIEESIFAGVPINVTLLFSREQYLAAPRPTCAASSGGIAAKRDPQRRFGRLAVREPLGQGGRRRRSRRAAQPARHRDRRAAPTGRIASCSPRRAGASSPPRARVRSACSGRAPEPRTPRRPTRSTSKRWRRPTPSTRCPRRRCTPSPSTARSAACMAEDGGDAEAVLGALREGRASTIDALAAELQRDGAQAFVKSWNEAADSASRTRARRSPKRIEPSRRARVRERRD